MTRGAAAGTAVLLAITCAACSAPPAGARSSGSASVYPDPADDWRRLIVVPLGTRLQAMPFAVDETLFFSEAHGAAPVGAAPVGASPLGAAAVGAAPVGAAPVGAAPVRASPVGAAPVAGAFFAGECFTPRGTLPAFGGGVAQSFVLCFAHDRLSLIQAAIDLPRPSAADLLRRYCDLWLSRTGGERSDAGCSGHDGDAAFSARLDLDAPEAAGRVSVAVYALNAGASQP